jgi:hypothetical protein
MRSLIPLALLALAATLHALPIPPPPSIPTTPQSAGDIQKWLDDSDAQWTATLAKEAFAASDAEIDKFCQRYLATVEARLAEARKAGSLEAVILWQKEKDAVSITRQMTADDPNDPAALKQVRAAGRAEMAKLAQARADKTRAILARYDAALSQAQVALTQRGQIDDALRIKARRDDLAANGLPGSKEALAAAPPPAAPIPPLAAPPVVPSKLAPSTPAPALPVGQSARLAAVEVEHANMHPLVSGQKAWSNRDNAIAKVPARYKGYQFTQFGVHSRLIKFKVKTDGTVNLAVPRKWWNPGPGGAPPEFRTEAQLISEGWNRRGGDEFYIGDDMWVVFSRLCKAGEQFSIATDRLESPILIYK